ncbi:MAG: thiamine-phosphate kinase [Proteobacteria bacterium]|nr:thiamine-phosphate kinase [Pseudomonadota bacterium]
MELKENELIKRIRKFGKKTGRITRGIGDDGAVVEMPQGSYVFVQDALVEHIHFEFQFMDIYALGKKAVYVNVSDVLSMGATPLYFLVTIGIPDRMSYKDIDRLYIGMMQAAKEFNIILIGGDISEAKTDFFIDISMIGKLVTKRYLGRDKAKVGDFIGITGHLGESAYGLLLLKQGSKDKGSSRFIKRYTNPKPPYDVWKELIKNDTPNAMMDISDGLVIDLERMMLESKKGAKIFLERLPIPRAIIKKKREMLALSGGEDYQFLFTFPGNKLEIIEDMRTKGFPVSIIGEVVKGRGVKLFKRGKGKRLNTKGYEHFGVHP